MKKVLKLIMLLFTLCSLILLASCTINSKSDIDDLNLLNANSINHRGFYTAPENTISAFRESARQGFKIVECDVSFTKDGYAVLLHDDMVDRTSNGVGSIGNLTLEEVRKLDFGSWKSEEYAGEKIPTFEEFIALCKDLSLQPYIEIKRGATAELLESLVQTVADFEITDGSVTWISFSIEYLAELQKIDSIDRLGYLCYAITNETIEQALSLCDGGNEVFLDCLYTAADKNSILQCKNKSIPLEVWTVNTVEEIIKLNSYISGVTSDKFITSDIIKAYAIQ